MTARWCFAVALAVLAAFPVDVLALSTADLERLLKGKVRPTVLFQEVRESPWLAAPVVTKGTMHSTPAGLEKRVESPVRETWRLLDDRVEWQGPQGGTKQIPFARAPALGALSGVMRRVVGGDLIALERDFEIQVAGDERAWRAQLIARDPQVRRQLESIEVQGSGGIVQVLIIVDRQGEKTSTRFQQ